MEKPTFYLTTAIAYASSKPHIGNTYDIVLADMIARYKRMMGFDVYFLTGSDEHGLKIEQHAVKEGITPQAYVDRAAACIKEVWDCMDVTYDRFIRTTSKRCKKSSAACMSRATFTRAVTKANTACRANPFLPPAS